MEEERLRRRIYMKSRQRAKNRGIPHLLTFKEYKDLAAMDCYYCGDPPEIKKRNSKQYPLPVYMNSIDRVDSDRGYIPGNVVSACTICNMMKREYRLEFFIHHIQKIYRKFAA